MGIKVEHVTDDMMPEISGWWESRGGGAMPDGVLPPNGYVSLDESGRMAAAGWVYLACGCRVAFAEWFVARPGMAAGQTRKALRAVLEAIEAKCREVGVTTILGTTATGVMAREAGKCGFSIVSTSNTHLAKSL